METAPNVHQIRCSYGKRNIFVYLLAGERSMLVDTGVADSPESEIIPYLRELGMDPHDLTYVLITHPDTDHQGGNDSIRNRCHNAIFIAHELDAPWIEETDTLIRKRLDYSSYGFPLSEEAIERVYRFCHSTAKMDILLRGGETFVLSPGWSVEVLHTPGHSWGHLTIYDRTHRLAIIQDAALGRGVPDAEGNPDLPPTYRFVESYLHTIQQLETLKIDLLLTAHFPPMHGEEIGQFLTASRDYCQNVQRLILETIRESPQPLGLPELIEQLGECLGDWPSHRQHMLAWSFLGHLELLEDLGQVTRHADRSYPRWTSRG